MKKQRPKANAALSLRQIDQLILVARGQRVMLDHHLAELYGVATKVLNQAVKRNSDRFPEDFAFRLSATEFQLLRSQIVTASWGGRRAPPWVFTEHGVAMLSSVLRSPTAARVNIQIMRAFVRLKRLMATPGELAERLSRMAEMVDFHDVQIKAIARVLQQLTADPPPPKEMGFHTLRGQRDSPA